MPRVIKAAPAAQEPDEFHDVEANKEAPTLPEPETPGEVEVEESPVDDPDDNLSLETADPNQILWDGGPTVGEALEFKKEFGEIYVTTISLSTGKFILWRSINRVEYRDIMRRVEELNASGQIGPSDVAMTQEELIAEVGILVPKMSVEDFQGELAGIPSLLSQQILEASGFVALDTRGL